MYDHDLSNEAICSKSYTVLKNFSNLILELFSKNISYDIILKIKTFKNEFKELKSKLQFSKEEDDPSALILQRLNYFLLESMHQETSGILRELIKDLYQCDDYGLITSVFNQKDYPKVFSSKIYSCPLDSFKIMSNEKEKTLKEKGDIFNNFVSFYPYNKEKALELVQKIGEEDGRIKFYESFFLMFNEYYHLLRANTLDILMNEDNYIPLTWKFYIAIMAVSTIRCEYLLRELEMQFLLKGGEEKWLVNGLIEVPEKLRKLEKINNILAHQPWKLNVQDIHEICNKYETSGWSLNELTHAVLIMTNYHKLASIIESLNIELIDENDENKLKLKNDQDKKSEDSKILKYISEGNVKDTIILELEDINKTMEKHSTIFDPGRKFSDEYKTFKIPSLLDGSLCKKEFDKHISNYCTVYLDFDSHSEEYSSYIEFNWQDHGSYILKNFFSRGVDSTNAEIDYVTNLTSNNIGGDKKKIDTTHYRNTISTYVEQIFGYMNESFDYSKTNKLLHRTHKQFIKNIACFPQKVTKVDVGVLKVTFNPEEILHIILLVSNSKTRVELTYFAKNLYEIIKFID